MANVWVFWSVERLAAGQLAYTDVVVSLVFFSGVREESLEVQTCTVKEAPHFDFLRTHLLSPFSKLQLLHYLTPCAHCFLDTGLTPCASVSILSRLCELESRLVGGQEVLVLRSLLQRM